MTTKKLWIKNNARVKITGGAWAGLTGKVTRAAVSPDDFAMVELKPGEHVFVRGSNLIQKSK